MVQTSPIPIRPIDPTEPEVPFNAVILSISKIERPMGELRNTAHHPSSWFNFSMTGEDDLTSTEPPRVCSFSFKVVADGSNNPSIVAPWVHLGERDQVRVKQLRAWKRETKIGVVSDFDFEPSLLARRYRNQPPQSPPVPFKELQLPETPFNGVVISVDRSFVVRNAGGGPNCVLNFAIMSEDDTSGFPPVVFSGHEVNPHSEAPMLMHVRPGHRVRVRGVERSTFGYTQATDLSFNTQDLIEAYRRNLVTR